jgi:hypothetical protein
MTSSSRLRGRVAYLPRLLVVLATSYFLIATSQPYEPYPSQVCTHANETVIFHVTGTCGPQGDILVISPTNECAVAVQGGGAVGLPSAGRFDSSGNSSVHLISNSWNLSGYLPESATPAPADAGIFTVERDAQASPDLGSAPDASGAGSPVTTPIQHNTPQLRICTQQSTYSPPSSLQCSGGGLPPCEAILTRL